MSPDFPVQTGQKTNVSISGCSILYISETIGNKKI